MQSQLNHEFDHLAEYFVDVSDLFADEISDDGLCTLLSTFLSISGHSFASISILGHGGLLEHHIDYSGPTGEYQHSNQPMNSHLMNRCMHTLQTEFTISGQDSSLLMKYAFPLRSQGKALGAIELKDESSNPLPESKIVTLQCLADVAASVIDRTHHIRQSRTLVQQLQTALDSRVVLEQAKGVLAERHKVGFPIAFQYLRNAARKEQVPIHRIAEKIVNGVTIPSQSTKVAN